MLHDIGFFIFSLFYLPALIFKGKLHRDFLERFGIYDAAKRRALAASGGAIWIQAVSVGEVGICKSLIAGLRARFPDRRIVVSTITKTGNDLAKKLFSNDAVVIYFPLDFSAIAGKVVALIRPRIYVMIETEIWPNLLSQTSRNRISAVLINGRISDRSFGRYRIAKPFLANVLRRIDRFCMQSSLDAERIASLGAPKERIGVTGNMKFDVDIKADSKAVQTMKETLSLEADEELFVAGSTHPGEEETVIAVFEELMREFPNLKLLIAPRHVERAGEVGEIIKKHGFIPLRLSTLTERRATGDGRRIFILDKIGYLASAYSFATLVFVGGSLVEHGGQNPIEPAVFEKAVIFGPHMFNFKDITAAFLKNGAAVQVSDKEGLLRNARALLKDRMARSELGKRARATVMAHRGATVRNIEELKRFL